MGKCVILAGEKMNILERAASVGASSADSLLPPSNLYLGRPAWPFRFGAIGTDDAITIDGDLLSGAGACESLAGWTTSGTVALDPTTKQAGASAIKTTDEASAALLLTARAGETIRLSAYLRGDGSVAMRARVRNLHTGNFWTGSAWQATGYDWATRVTATFAQWTTAFVVEDFAGTHRDPSGLAPLQITFYTTGGSGTGWVDEVYAWNAGANLLSVHGHNIPPSVAVQWRGSSDNFAGSDVEIASIGLEHPAFCRYQATPQDYRYHRLKLAGSSLFEPVEIGELVIGQATVFPRSSRWSYELRELEEDVSNELSDGEIFPEELSSRSRRGFALMFDFADRAAYEIALKKVKRLSRGRRWPLVICPDTDLPEVIFGRCEKTWKVARTLPTIYQDAELVVTESPFSAATL